MKQRLRNGGRRRDEGRKRQMQRERKKKKRQLHVQPSWPRRRQGSGRRSLKGIWRRVRGRRRQLEKG